MVVVAMVVVVVVVVGLRVGRETGTWGRVSLGVQQLVERIVTFLLAVWVRYI